MAATPHLKSGMCGPFIFHGEATSTMALNGLSPWTLFRLHYQLPLREICDMDGLEGQINWRGRMPLSELLLGPCGCSRGLCSAVYASPLPRALHHILTAPREV
jgi:hypothetical protein